ncbi:DUF2235 domain-containing protein [Bradyrhizobium japonicum]|uniref:DUF2235 domain-containing protein n=1 Tax=Bradyrhizobium japonicum TaxID=375 RepID=UPI001BAC35C1|nr:DUF2235 domain-containing protein [Bradyrhizobium japonicum]MBR0734146.1 DUF2235 domain-containing protein [Bradyrhizobium japonicum]MBR0809279.1 DUF2235 domain-containing protein [Bradyrhizobium japonicum]
MARRLILCIDGTWNSRAEETRFFVHPTNVQRISELLVNDGKQQLVFYLRGVGTDSLVDRFVGGVWGAGIHGRVRDGYRILCENYREGDQIALIGFSRGAFAVRQITGVMALIGLLKADRLNLFDRAFSLGMRRFARSIDNEESLFVSTNCHRPVPIRFLGVFDTVIRYGPFLALPRMILERAMGRHIGFHDHVAPWFVVQIAHALALDECRINFEPWRYLQSEDWRQRVEERWFAGHHSDVGGGCADSRAAEISLRWMAECAQEAGLMFTEMPHVGDRSHCAPLNPSRIGAWRLMPFRRRVVEISDSIHPSVELRTNATGYRPFARCRF